jgi:uncharacterized protein YcfL
MRTWMLLLLIAVAAAGCDSKKKEPPPDIIKSQRQVMDKAKGVEQVLQKSADERREQSEQK